MRIVRKRMAGGYYDVAAEAGEGLHGVRGERGREAVSLGKRKVALGCNVKHLRKVNADSSNPFPPLMSHHWFFNALDAL
jgi:hypothetical protein